MKGRKKRVLYINKSNFSLKKFIKLLSLLLVLFVIGSIYFFKSFLLYRNNYQIVLFIFCIVYVIIFAYSVIRLNELYITKHKYQLTMKKIKSKYGDYIKYYKYNFNSNKYKNIIEINNIKELVFLSKKTGFKIKYFESIPGEKSFFLLEHNNTLYKYVLTKY